MQSESSDGLPEKDVNVQSGNSSGVTEPMKPMGKTSIWAAARAALADATSQAQSKGGAVASNLASLGGAGATRAVVATKQTFAAASDATLATVESGKRVYSGSKLESTIQYLDGELEQRGAKQAFKDTTGAVVEKLDQVTGKRLVELLEAKLRLQDSYNDILATRLAEALDRVATLDARVAALESRLSCEH